jgi:hypothetical protein
MVKVGMVSDVEVLLTGIKPEKTPECQLLFQKDHTGLRCARRSFRNGSAALGEEALHDRVVLKSDVSQ